MSSLAVRKPDVRTSVAASLEDELARIGLLAARPIDNPHELAATLRQIYHALCDIDLARYEPSAIARQAPSLMRMIFAARMRLRDRTPDWQARSFMTRPVQNAMRDVFRTCRYVLDMLGETAIGHKRLGPSERARRAFTGSEHNTHVHAKFDTGANLSFRSGDVLVVRGSNHNSAAIARIGDVDTQFSHVAMVYIDAAGKHWVVEALIEDGAVINALEHELDHGLGRAVLYRHRDGALAQRAAELIHARVLAATTGRARHIPYDFSMRLKGRGRLFCAKLVQQAFLDASGGKVDLPAFKTHFDPRNRPFLKAIGVKVAETFTPGDMDLDPAFDLVAEWQDYRATPRLRRQDMIMTKFFEWMETRGWRFEEDFLVRLVAVFGHLSSYLSNGARELVSSVVPKVPRNMGRGCIAAIAMLHKTAEVVMPSLQELEESHVRMTGRPLHPREMLAHLERLREVSGGRIGYLVGPA